MPGSPRREHRTVEGRGRSVAPALTAVGLTVAGVLHGFEALAHRGAAAGTGHALFFTVAATLQLVAALALMVHRSPRVLLAVAGANAGIATLWLASVTVAVPGIGDAPAPVGLAGALATVAEATVVAAVVYELCRRRHGERASALAAVRPAWAAAGLAAMLVAPVGVTGVGAGGHHHDSGVHLHGLGGDAFDPGPAPGAAAATPVGTRHLVDPHPSAVAVDGDRLWVASRSTGTIRRYSLDGAPVGRPVAVGEEPAGIVVAGEFVWVANAGDGTVTRVSRATGTTVGSPVAVGRVPVGLAAGFGSVWVANSGDGSVTRLDERTGEVQGYVRRTPDTSYDVVTAGGAERVGYGPIAVATGEGAVWIVNSLEREVVRVDPRRDVVVGDPIKVPPGATDVVVAHGSVWVASSTHGSVTRIEPRSAQVIGAPIEVDDVSQPGMGPAGLAITSSGVWVANNHDRTLIRLDPRTGEPSGPKFFGDAVAEHPQPMAIDARGGVIWLADYDRHTIVRYDP